jgi:hypothetical protein
MGEKAAQSRSDNYLLAHSFVGEAVTGISCGQFRPDSGKIVVAVTISGSVLAFVPIIRSEEGLFLQALESAMRGVQEEVGALARACEGESLSLSLSSSAAGGGGGGGGVAAAAAAALAQVNASGSSLCYRNHHSFRSYFTPVKNTIDLDLCERFALLPAATQARVAGLLSLSLFGAASGSGSGSGSGYGYSPAAAAAAAAGGSAATPGAPRRQSVFAAGSGSSSLLKQAGRG